MTYYKKGDGLLIPKYRKPPHQGEVPSIYPVVSAKAFS